MEIKNKAQKIIDITVEDGWKLIVADIQEALGEVDAQLDNWENTRDKDQYLRGQKYALKLVLDLPNRYKEVIEHKIGGVG